MKKLYSNTLMQLIIALCTFSFVACQEYSIDSQPEGPLNIQIDAQDSYTALATSPSNVVFNISSNTPWTIESDAQWCVPTPSMSASSSLVSEIVVTMENNTGKQSRTAKLTIKAEGISNTKVVTITQASKEDLVVIPYDELVATEGEDITFTIASNKPWEIIPSTAFISNIDKKSGTGNEDAFEETITIKVPANAGARREGTITVKTEFMTYTFTITQNGVVIEQEEDPESTTISVGGTSTGGTVKIRANKEWKVEVPKEYQSWLKAEALSDTELKITTTVNNQLSTRVGHIILKTKEVVDGFEGITFDINQSPAFWFNGSSENRVIDEATGDVKIMAVAGNNVIANYAIKKGHLTFELADINLNGESCLHFNLWPNAGNANIKLWLRSNSDCDFRCAGGFGWGQKMFSLTTEELNAIRTIEFFVEDDPDNIGKLRVRLSINGEEIGNLVNQTNIYETDPSNNPGQVINLQFEGGLNYTEGDYYTVKSITYEPAE
ncbi:BACON domain-containing protein [Bacteroides faecalis]|uniref:BACON domain-containing protein n=1 Tax=Bacteroides faecalis TaxID=2447885 RepID=A0A401LPS8_9BACE|nr:BACON domain-containing carbohydrate-binding protein [Bacteroides faecalis]GCB33514.1 hypothetical protein KGMB02408_04590 [Bacteroides faecalis]